MLSTKAALQASVGMGERWYEPEKVLRLRAEMLIAQSGPGLQEAEERLASAIAMAQQQDARLWELRSCNIPRAAMGDAGATC